MNPVFKLIGSALLLAAACFLWPSSARAQLPDLRMLREQQHVNDFAGIIDSPAKVRTENILTSLYQRTGINFVVVTIKSAGNQDLYEYALGVANESKIGAPASPEKSLLLLISTDNAKFFTLASSGAQLELPDGLIWLMGKGMGPKFQRGDYGLGLQTGLQTFATYMGPLFNFTFETLDKDRAGQSQPSAIRRVPVLTGNAPLLPVAFQPIENPVTTRTGSPGAVVAKPTKPPPPSAATEVESSRSIPVSPVMKSASGRSLPVLPPEKAVPLRLVRFKTRRVIDGRLDDEIW
jgi:uncharacterized membrane protein YgcG